MMFSLFITNTPIILGQLTTVFYWCMKIFMYRTLHSTTLYMYMKSIQISVKPHFDSVKRPFTEKKCFLRWEKILQSMISPANLSLILNLEKNFNIHIPKSGLSRALMQSLSNEINCLSCFF